MVWRNIKKFSHFIVVTRSPCYLFYEYCRVLSEENLNLRRDCILWIKKIRLGAPLELALKKRLSKSFPRPNLCYQRMTIKNVLRQPFFAWIQSYLKITKTEDKSTDNFIQHVSQYTYRVMQLGIMCNKEKHHLVFCYQNQFTPFLFSMQWEPRVNKTTATSVPTL